MGSESQRGSDEFSGSSEMLVREQYNSLSRLVPVLYSVVITAIACLCLAFNGTAPAWLIYWLPIAILVIVTLRLRYWIKARAFVHDQDIDIIRRDIRGAKFIGPSITLALTLIGLGLMPYSDPYQQSLAVVTIWITAIASAFCLAALPSASKMVVLSAGLPITISFLWSGNELKVVLAGLFGIITCLVIYILSQTYAAFTSMVQSRAEINEKRRQAEVAQQTATKLAYTDYLTNLANCRYFELLLNERISHPEQRRKPFAAGIIDLDGLSR